MKIVVDFQSCESNALCVAAAPDLFDIDDDDYLQILQEEVPADRVEAAKAAARACPKQAITFAD